MRRPRKTMVNEHFAPAPDPAVHTIEVDGEAVLLNEDQGRLQLLNATGALVWACCDGQSTIGEIVTDISDELGAPREVVLADTLAITRRLASEGVFANVEPEPSRGTPVEVEAGPRADDRFIPEPPNP